MLYGSTLKLVADHMEAGFLENIIDMFKHDPGLFQLVPSLMRDERGRVRIGVVALIESMREEQSAHIDPIFSEVADLLADRNPLVRADAAYLLGVAWPKKALPYLEIAARHEIVKPVKQMLEETVQELRDGLKDR